MHVRKGAVAAAASAASAALAAAAYEIEHRSVSQADLADSRIRIQRLWDLRADRETLDLIGRGLTEEWGSSAFLGFQSLDEMASRAGQDIFVARRVLDSGELQVAVLQTTRVEAGGDPARLLEAFPDFAALTSYRSWSSSEHRSGDTVVLLQITTLGRQERGGGLGSQLRNAALHLQPGSVRYALTTTPVDSEEGVALDLDDPSTFTAAMRFHVRGGAAPATVMPGYKAQARQEGAMPARHASDVVVMRYVRDSEGSWPAAKPAMRIRRAGPLQQRISLAWRRLRRARRRSRT